MGAAGILGALAGLALGVALGWMLTRFRVARRLIDQQRALEQARSQARTDPMTQLWNRGGFDEHLRHWTAVCRRYGGAVSLILLDLDAFKEINDRYGHAAGDAALVHLAGILRDSSREADLVARVGGDEFAMLLPHTGTDGAHALAERIRRQVESAPCPSPAVLQRDGAATLGRPAPPTLPLRVSAGVSEYHAGQTPAELFDKADRALYLAKQSGGNRVLAGEAEPPVDQRPSDSSIR
jgi:diguanylate cyclase (GGDEF)-like protein